MDDVKAAWPFADGTSPSITRSWRTGVCGPGQLLAYAPEPRTDLVPAGSGQLEYRARHGDNYFNIAFSLDVDLDALRERNGLWRLQVLPAGMRLLVPLDWKGKHTVHRVTAGETLEEIAKELDSEPWRIIRDNALWEEAVSEGMVLRVRPTPPGLPTSRTASPEVTR